MRTLTSLIMGVLVLLVVGCSAPAPSGDTGTDAAVDTGMVTTDSGSPADVPVTDTWPITVDTGIADTGTPPTDTGMRTCDLDEAPITCLLPKVPGMPPHDFVGETNCGAQFYRHDAAGWSDGTRPLRCAYEPDGTRIIQVSVGELIGWFDCGGGTICTQRTANGWIALVWDGVDNVHVEVWTDPATPMSGPGTRPNPGIDAIEFRH
jgi:hypothetical protein